MIPILTPTITLCGIIDEDFVNYKKPAMSLMFPTCTFKCGKEHCQNRDLINESQVTTGISDIYRRYINNPITEAIVCQGMEPFDSWRELNSLLQHFRIHEACFDDIVIYTGYDKDEIAEEVDYIKTMYSNVIIKFGRYLPGQKPHYDEVLGVNLASDNQYAEVIDL
jgi:pyruvate-formate lyase-activating enzyme